MIQNYFQNVKRFLGSFISNACARKSWGKCIYLFSFSKIGGSPVKRAMRAGKKKKGYGENEFLPACQKRSSAALLVKSRTQQKSFLFLLEEKIGRAQIRKSEENFFAGWRALASGGGAERQSSQSGFSSKKVRILTKRHRQFSEFGFWAIVASPRQRRGSASARILKGFLKSKNNFCPLKRKFGLPKANINLKNLLTKLFSFAFGERQSDNLILTAPKI